jgi:prepilin peptidase CpaA
MWPDLFHYILFALFPAALAYAAISDLLTLTIPNRLVLAIVVVFVLLAPFAGIGWGGFALHLAAGGIVLVLGFACFAFGWIGGGDAKFAAAIALFLGMENALVFVGLASVLGGGLTFLLLGFRQAPVPALIIRQPWVQRLHSPATGVPYGIALAAAAALIYPHSVWAGVALG